MQLKGGFETDDRRLDRLVQFDERSRGFRALEAITERELRNYTWNFREYDPGLNQGAEGACVGFAWANELALFPAMVRSVDRQYARSIYKAAQKIDEWPGESYEGTSVIAGAKVVRGELELITEYRWALTLEELLLAVGYAGPGILGVNWYEGMMDIDPHGFIHPSGSVVGGHAIVMRGTRLTKLDPAEPLVASNIHPELSSVLLRNSWGPSWGVGGDCRLKISDLDRLRREDGEFCVPMGRRRKP